MKTILISGIGSDIAQGVAKIVREIRPDWKIIGVDIHQRHGGRLYTDELETVPKANDPTYLSCMENIVDRHDVDVCIPISEAELAVLAERKIFSFARADLIGVAYSALEVCLDKLTTINYIKNIGIPVPWTIAAEKDVEPLQLPCIFKPRRSAGSKGVFICRDGEDAKWYARKEPLGVFQELLLPSDQEVTCAVYRDKSGKVAVLPMLRELVDGATAWAKVIADPDIMMQCTEIAEALNLQGAINIQLRLTEKGPRIFEINPRLSSTVYLRHLLGFTDLKWMLDEYEEKTISYPKIAPNSIGVRVQGALVVS